MGETKVSAETLGVEEYLNNDSRQHNAGVYTIYDSDMRPQYVGHSKDLASSIQSHLAAVGPERCVHAEIHTDLLITEDEAGIKISEILEGFKVKPPGNSAEAWKWNGILTLPDFAKEVNDLKSSDEEVISPFAESRSSDENSSAGMVQQDDSNYTEMTEENVDYILETVRPYLNQDGGNVALVSVLDGVVTVRLEGSCSSCPSSAVTMRNGIEHALRNAFGPQLKEVTQVQFSAPATLDAVNDHLSLFKPTLNRYDGDISCIAVLDGVATVMFRGPDMMFPGVAKALRERFPGQIESIDKIEWILEEAV